MKNLLALFIVLAVSRPVPVVADDPQATSAWPRLSLSLGLAGLWGGDRTAVGGDLYVGVVVGRASADKEGRQWSGWRLTLGGEAFVGQSCFAQPTRHCDPRILAGPALRVGWATVAHEEMRAPDFEVFASAGGFAGVEAGDLAYGGRVSVGVSALAFSRRIVANVFEDDGEEDSIADWTSWLALPLALFNHIEVVVDITDGRALPRTTRAGVLVGFSY